MPIARIEKRYCLLSSLAYKWRPVCSKENCYFSVENVLSLQQTCSKSINPALHTCSALPRRLRQHFMTLFLLWSSHIPCTHIKTDGATKRMSCSLPEWLSFLRICLIVRTLPAEHWLTSQHEAPSSCILSILRFLWSKNGIWLFCALSKIVVTCAVVLPVARISTFGR